VRLTEKEIRKLPVPEKGNRITYDDQVRGLGLRVTAGNARAFVLNYRTNGRERRLTIGPWPEWSATAAREHAKELRRTIDRGEDPLSAKEQLRKDPTFGELVAEYLRVEASKQKRSEEYARIFKHDALPHWRNLRAADIRRRDVIALIERKAETAPVAANRLFELIRRMFNFAVRRDILETNPCALVKKPTEEKSKERVLSHEEIEAFWKALDGPWFTPLAAAALRLILVTAQRPGEVATMRWENLDLAGWWTIPGDVAKNGLSHRVPLNETARDILETLPKVSPWVFPSPTEGEHAHRNSLGVVVRRARLRKPDPLTVNNFSPHDLRRTAASLMASAGVERFLIGRILNHKEPGVTAIYDRHSYDNEKRAAMDKWDRLLSSILGKAEPSKVAVIS
jgi:integrase